ANTIHSVAGPTAVQLTLVCVAVVPATVTAVGLGQVGGGAQIMSAVHPGLLNKPSLTNLNVRHPEALVASKGPGIAVPQKAPGADKPPFPGPLPLKMGGAFTESPSYTYNPSQLDSVLKEVNTTVTISPGFSGQIVIVEFELFG